MQVARHIFSYTTYYIQIHVEFAIFSEGERNPPPKDQYKSTKHVGYTAQCNAHLGPMSAPSCFTPQPHFGQGAPGGYVVGSQEAPIPSSNLGSTFGMPTEQKKEKTYRNTYLTQDIFS